jgi:hypothetical protein
MPLETMVQILGVISTLVGWLHVFMLYLCWRIGSRPKGSVLWIYAIAIYSIAFLLFGQRDTLDSSVVTILIPNFLVLFAQSLALIGVCKYLQVRIPIRLVAVVYAVYFLIFPIFIYVYCNMHIRTVIMAALVMSVHLQIAWLLLTSTRKRPFTYSVAACMFMFMSSIDVVRLIRGLSLSWSDQVVSDPLTLGAIMATALFAIPLASCAFIMLIYESDIARRKHAEQQLQLAESLLEQNRHDNPL